MNYSALHLQETVEIARAINPDDIENLVYLLKGVKQKRGRLFILGLREPQVLKLIFNLYDAP